MKSYATTRYPYFPDRKIVWEEICRYLNRHYISNDSEILELGSGYGDFIGNIHARKRVAIENDIAFKEYLSDYPNVTVHYLDAKAALKTFPKRSFDVVFCSNFFEHFEISEVRKLLDLVAVVLKTGGKLVILQPNFQLCSPLYFDDWTHKSVFSHVSLSDLLQCHGFNIYSCIKKFLPFSMKSRLPISRVLVRLYLNSPVKPFAAQFLIVAVVSRSKTQE